MSKVKGSLLRLILTVADIRNPKPLKRNGLKPSSGMGSRTVQRLWMQLLSQLHFGVSEQSVEAYISTKIILLRINAF